MAATAIFASLHPYSSINCVSIGGVHIAATPPGAVTRPRATTRYFLKYRDGTTAAGIPINAMKAPANKKVIFFFFFFFYVYRVRNWGKCVEVFLLARGTYVMKKSSK